MLSHLINNLLRGFICPKTCGSIKNHKKHNLPSPGGIGQFIHEKHNWGDACLMVRWRDMLQETIRKTSRKLPILTIKMI